MAGSIPHETIATDEERTLQQSGEKDQIANDQSSFQNGSERGVGKEAIDGLDSTNVSLLSKDEVCQVWSDPIKAVCKLLRVEKNESL